MIENVLWECSFFSRENYWKKRGLCIIPTKFGIGYISHFLNQVIALCNSVHLHWTGPHFPLCKGNPTVTGNRADWRSSLLFKWKEDLHVPICPVCFGTVRAAWGSEIWGQISFLSFLIAGPWTVTVLSDLHSFLQSEDKDLWPPSLWGWEAERDEKILQTPGQLSNEIMR